MIDLPSILERLATERPVFHSEADFQHALAWKLHEVYPDAAIRLEYRPISDEPLYAAIWFRRGSDIAAIELKYVTRRLDTTVFNERFVLANHGAQPLRRYDFLKDINRLEQFTGTHTAAIGYAVMLTNESTYWRASRGRITTDAAFRIHEG